MKAKICSLSFFVIILVFVSGCGSLPRKTFEAGGDVFVDALVIGNRIVCPSPVSLVVYNHSDMPLEVKIDARSITVIPPRAAKNIHPLESPYRNGMVMVSGTLFSMTASGRRDEASYEFWMLDHGPVNAQMIVSAQGLISGGWSTPYSPYSF